ncbi:hypothetical protein AMC99_01241 [Altererythrobacter epoxidivorans]|uniref:ATPase n=1 Tax=Altererythrobacter epoxidivorans TaxID=361183 RepID=A0A0M4M7R7_9SPHN|nr:hypothetical protein [Altererythrobacter epoxidivorans]ALE16535.1 hypothetical protein AMC99_01241 [Altererythrobacter epoxidivorans]
MTGGSHIRAVGPEAAQEAQDHAVEQTSDDTLALEEEWQDEWEELEEERAARSFAWIVPAAAIFSVIAWTAFFVWTFRDAILSGGTPEQWIGWVINWSVPVLLIVSLWLLAMRNSRRESVRFADAAAALARESRELESRLIIVNRELSLAREFLGSQSRDLESLGRIAAERLSTHADQLQGLIHNNSAQIDSISSVSTTALENMQKLRDDLPVIANSAKDVSSQVGNAGRTAREQLDKLIAGFGRLNEFGTASGNQVDALSAKVASTIDAFEQQVDRLDVLATERFEALAAKSEEFRVDLDGREVDALAAMRHRADELRNGLVALQSEFTDEEERSLDALKSRIELVREEGSAIGASIREAEELAFKNLRNAKDRLHDEVAAVISDLDQLDAKALEAAQARVKALHEEAGRFDDLLAVRDAKFNEEIANRQDQFETRETQASEALAQRLSDLDDAIEERTEAQLARAERMVAHGQELAAKVSEINSLFERVSEHASGASQQLDTGLSGLEDKLSNNRSNLEATNAALAEVTESSIRLLEILQSGARQSREDLPKAIETASAKLERVEERAALLRDTMNEASNRGDALSNYLITTQDNIEHTGKNIDALHMRLRAHSDDNLVRLQSLQALVSDLEGSSERLANHASDSLQNAISELLKASKEAFATLEKSAEDVVNKAADGVAGLASSAVQRSLQTHSLDAIEQIEQVAIKASQAGRETTIQLRDQLSKVNELAGNLEQRVTRAREIAQEQVDNDFARRMALITDSLNSSAIDISKALAEDVADTSWAAYLRGDRGIFTRRAVRLIDNSEAREIVELYETDDDFREHVSRYIHDFEAMLRSLLSTRDGNSLGVTVLSSDMGKLYVALAQAIERLRN